MNPDQGKPKLTAVQENRIRRTFASGYSDEKALARQYGVPLATIRRVVSSTPGRR